LSWMNSLTMMPIQRDSEKPADITARCPARPA
jgi:hypothetical protein